MTSGQRATGTSHETSFANRAFACLPYVSLFGFALLIANIMVSFEEPHRAMLSIAALLVIAAPVGMLVHLTTNSELAPAEKRMWLAALAGRKGPGLFAAYFNETDRARATHMLVSLGRSGT